MDYSEILGTAGRAFGVYIFILIILRLSGKRTVGNFTPFDLLAAMMLAEVTEEIVFGNVSLAVGAAAIVSIAIAQHINSWLCYKSPTFDSILEGKPIVIVKDGKLQKDGMRAERMNEDEVFSELRHSGVDDVKEVRLAVVECDGHVSVIRHEWAKAVQKKDHRAGRATATHMAAGEKSDSIKKNDTLQNLENA